MGTNFSLKNKKSFWGYPDFQLPLNNFLFFTPPVEHREEEGDAGRAEPEPAHIGEVVDLGAGGVRDDVAVEQQTGFSIYCFYMF